MPERVFRLFFGHRPERGNIMEEREGIDVIMLTSVSKLRTLADLFGIAGTADAEFDNSNSGLCGMSGLLDSIADEIMEKAYEAEQGTDEIDETRAPYELRDLLSPKVLNDYPCLRRLISKANEMGMEDLPPYSVLSIFLQFVFAEVGLALDIAVNGDKISREDHLDILERINEIGSDLLKYAKREAKAYEKAPEPAQVQDSGA